MDDLKKALADANDEYLIGISNKGVLKRAYKDLETAFINPGFIDKTADITVDNTQCVIKVPLAQSICSCPSKTICRHIITAVLWLKKELLSEKPQSEQTSLTQSSDIILPELSVSGIVPENITDVIQPPQIGRLEKELTEYPVDKLQKVMKKKYFNSFIEKARVGALPKLEEGSTVTADIYEENVSVKLLSPLEYSACTCRSKEMCKHKAGVILAWKLRHKVITLDSLVPVRNDANIDNDKLNSCAGHCLAFVERLLSDGLVRTPADAAEYAEANALICHNAGFSEGENLLRETGSRLKAYAAHSPEFSVYKLFCNIMDTYILMNNVRSENDPQKLKTLTGEFKSSYNIEENINIIPLAQRKINSISGYEGEIYYFLNKSKSGDRLPYLTFSDVRPSYYDNNSYSRKTNAPWGLYGSCSILMNFEMRLILPKISGIRLSSSSETQAFQICRPNLNQHEVYEKIYTDFRKLIEENLIRTNSNEEDGSLVMIMPERCVSSSFSETSQRHTIVVEDFFEQQLKIQAHYHSKTRSYFEQLASVGKKMLEAPEKSYVIFGSIFIDEGQCSIYPIAVFDHITVPKPPHIKREPPVNKSSVYFLQLFQRIANMLCGLTECGINSFDYYSQINDFASECEASGLSFLSRKLTLLSQNLAARNHTYSNDNKNIITLLGEVYSYLKTGIEKTEIQCAIIKLYEKDDNNESAERHT